MIYINNGIKNEEALVQSLNQKNISELNENLKHFIKFIFNDIKNEDIIIANRIKNQYKADICIQVNDIKKNISIKNGSENSIHSEKLELFLNFLKSININSNILDYLKIYHFGDDTKDGMGLKRYSAEEAKIKYRKEIAIFNKYINNNNILIKIIDRFLFNGTDYNIYLVDYIYYGNEKYGIWASKNEIIKYLVINKCSHIKTIHFSALTYQNWCRNINRNIKSESHRYYIQIKWFSIVSDLEKIRDQSHY